MREQALEENLVEDYLDKHDTTGREAKAYAYSAVVDMMVADEEFDVDFEALDALADFPDLLEEVEN